jgi:hypothetical protein
MMAAKDNAGDPLLGPSPPPATATPPATAQAWLPPIPQNSGGATNAALAGQTQPPQALAIGSPPSGEGWLRKIDNAPTTLRAPITPVSQPRVEPVPKDNSFTVAASPAIQPAGSWAAGSPSAAPTPEQLKQMLDARGVIGAKQEVVADGIHLRVAVSSPANPDSNQIYETTAVDYATAVQAIVQQIDHRP